MANFPPLPAAPYGSKAPFPSLDANTASENFTKTINASDGSSHAPSGDIALSGANGGGLAFSTVDPVPFKGKLDVTTGLTCTAPSAGSVIFDKLVAVDVRGPMTFKASPGGAPGSAQFESGCVCTFASGSTLTCASGSTTNLTGATLVRGTMTIKETGGPGSVIFENNTNATFNEGSALGVLGSMVLGPDAVLGAYTGAGLTGELTSTAVIHQNAAFTMGLGERVGLSPARTWTRWGFRVAAVGRDSGVPQAADDKFSPLFNAPSLYCLGGSSDTTLTAIFEIDPPPDGSTFVQVQVTSVGGDTLHTITDRPVYTIVRWARGLQADFDSLSVATTDAHPSTAGNWIDVMTTTIAVTANALVDRAFRYGLLVNFPWTAAVPQTKDFYLDIKATGTATAILGT